MPFPLGIETPENKGYSARKSAVRSPALTAFGMLRRETGHFLDSQLADKLAELSPCRFAPSHKSSPRRVYHPSTSISPEASK
jgi:hypothetical protein